MIQPTVLCHGTNSLSENNSVKFVRFCLAPVAEQLLCSMHAYESVMQMQPNIQMLSMKVRNRTVDENGCCGKA